MAMFCILLLPFDEGNYGSTENISTNSTCATEKIIKSATENNQPDISESIDSDRPNSAEETPLLAAEVQVHTDTIDGATIEAVNSFPATEAQQADAVPDSSSPNEDEKSLGSQAAPLSSNEEEELHNLSKSVSSSPVKLQRQSTMFTIKEAVEAILYEEGVPHAVWSCTAGSHKTTQLCSLQPQTSVHFWQVSLVMPKSMCDSVVRRLTTLGVGRIVNTHFSLYPANYSEGQISLGEGHSCNAEDGESEKSEFYKSIKSRLVVAQVVDSVRTSAALTFDFVIFVVLASILAALGLAENSSVILVASMLVSPIMGPILAGVFGFVVSHKSLWRLGVRNEVIALTLCIICGFVMGLVTGLFNLYGNTLWGSSNNWPNNGDMDSWPTDEMRSRGQTRSLWVGLLIALPSGAGVALSILGGNAGSLVGVAISASLLPPAVNAGMLWSYAFLAACSVPWPASPSQPPTLLPNIDNGTLMNNVTTVLPDQVAPIMPSPPNCPSLPNNQYDFMYSCYMPYEALILGLVSLLLTFLNIICIFVMGILVLKTKEVAPEMSVPEYTRSFWRNDIKVARDAYKTLVPGTSDTQTLAKHIAEEFKKKKDRKSQEDAIEMLGKGENITQEFLEEVKKELRRRLVVEPQPDEDPKPYFTIGPNFKFEELKFKSQKGRVRFAPQEETKNSTQFQRQMSLPASGLEMRKLGEDLEGQDDENDRVVSGSEIEGNDTLEVGELQGGMRRESSVGRFTVTPTPADEHEVAA